MPDHANTCPLTERQLLEDSFMEHRAQVLAVAAFLDRLERARERDAGGDFRLVALRRALRELNSPQPGRVKRIQMLLSDQDLSLLEARDQQSAHGVPTRSGFPQDGGEQ